MMPSKLDALLEAERRGILEPRTRAALEVAKKRGLDEKPGANVTTGLGPIADVPVTVAAGANVGLANVAGAPVDAMNALLGLAPQGSPLAALSTERPVGGSKQLRDWMGNIGLGYESREDVPKAYRPFAKAGEIAGESIPFAAAPLAAVRAGVKGPQMLQPILEAARRSPGAFTAAEAGGAAGAAIGGGLAEAYAPGNEAVSLPAELAGGFLHPLALLNRATKGAMDVVGKGRQMFSPSARQAKAGDRLTQLVEAAGEDVGGIRSRLAQDLPDIPGLRYTSAQKAESPTLLALQQKLMRDIPDFGNTMRQRMSDTTEALNRAHRAAVEGGDPLRVREVALGRQRWFASLMDTRMVAAEQKALSEAGELAPMASKAELGRQVRTTMEEALTDARAVERKMWAEVPRDIEVEPRNLLESYAEARGSMLEEENLPAPIEAFIDRVRTGETPITSGDLLRFRSRVLEMERDIRGSAAPSWSTHRQLKLLAEGALEDLAGLSDEARDFSRALNDRFTKGEAGRLLGYERRGGPRVEPELTLEASIGRGGEGAGVKSRQIEAAAQNVPGVTQRTTLGAQGDFLKNMLRSVVDPKTGKINAKSLAKFRGKNAEILAQFPALQRSMSNAGSAQDMLERVAGMRTKALKAVQQKSAFARVAGYEDPTRAIGAILDGKTPMRDYREMARLAKKSGPEALAGLRQATFDHLTNQALQGDLISGYRMRALLDGGLMDTMRRQGVVSKQQAANFGKVIDATEKLEDSLGAGMQIDKILEDVTGLEDLLIRIMGANIGGMGAVGRSTGAPFVAAQAGSRFARQLVEKVPMDKTRDILARALDDPTLMQALLSKGGTKAERRMMERQINAFLLQTAISSDEGEQPSNIQGFTTRNP